MRSDQLYLRDILDAIALVTEFLAGQDEISFSRDEKTKAAVLAKFMIIGEAAKRLLDTFANRYPDIQWTKAGALRNLITHGYFSVDYGILYQTARRDLPVLRQQIEAILTAEFPDSVQELRAKIEQEFKDSLVRHRRCNGVDAQHDRIAASHRRNRHRFSFLRPRLDSSTSRTSVLIWTSFLRRLAMNFPVSK